MTLEIFYKNVSIGGLYIQSIVLLGKSFLWNTLWVDYYCISLTKHFFVQTNFKIVIKYHHMDLTSLSTPV